MEDNFLHLITTKYFKAVSINVVMLSLVEAFSF